MKRVCDAAVEILYETANPGVMWGDERLLHMIAERMGWPHDGHKTSKRVIRALSKTPGPLVVGYIKRSRHWLLNFDLPKRKPCSEESS